MTPLRILSLEDDPLDFELIEASLVADGLTCQCERVWTRSAFEAALGEPRDLILSDYSLPDFDGIAAQTIARERRPDLPFVFVSGAMGEEAAVERLRAGATDIVLKSRLGRLPAAVRRAVREAQEREERRRAQAALVRLHAELEYRVKERTAQLERANEQLARREAELRHNAIFLDSILENLPAVVFVKDAAERRYVQLNRGAEVLLGRPRRELIGRTDRELFPEQVAKAFEATDAELLEERRADVVTEEVVPTPADGVRILHSKKIPIRDGGGRIQYLLGIAIDITERRHAEEALRLAKLEAEQANRAKSDFVSRMSHDLRTPLNAILGFAQLLEADADLQEEHAEGVRQILSGGRHLLVLIDEVLDIARIEAGRMSLSPEPVRVADAIHEVVALLRPLAASRRISMRVEIDGAGWMLVDQQRIKQVLHNLVGNALKYNRDDGTVSVSAVRQSGTVRIEVSDTGPGIPAASRGRLFEPFERLNAGETAVEGAGLGLAISKKLVEAMKGRIGLMDSAAGASFWISLPSCSPPKPRSAEAVPHPDAGRLRRARILYIEDNSANLRLMERALARWSDAPLLVARTAADGISCALRERPDLILLDMHLPDGSGEDVVRVLSADSRTAAISVVVLSADATQVSRRRLEKAGVKAYLTKPLVLPALMAVLEQSLATGETAHGGLS